MDFVLVTQRVEHLFDRGESRDAIDQKWSELLFEAGLLPLFLPNNLQIANAMIHNLEGSIAGALLTGGNSIQACDGDSPERDKMELFLIDYCNNHELPILGVCRGMQLVMSKYQGKFRRVENQVQKKQAFHLNTKVVVKNSYHEWECINIPDDFSVFAHTDSNVVKGVKHKTKNITGIMWHPERLVPFHSDDIEMIKDIFKS